MDFEVTSQLIPSDSADMAAEAEPNLSRSGDEVSITEEVHAFHISIDKQASVEEIISNIGATDWQWHEARPLRSCNSGLAGMSDRPRNGCLNVQKVDLKKNPQ